MGLFDRQRKVDLVRVFFPLLVFDIIPGNGSDRRAEIVFDEAGKQFVGDIYEAPAVEGFRPDDLFEVEYGGLDLPYADILEMLILGVLKYCIQRIVNYYRHFLL